MILFPDATDRLTSAVTHQQLADRLGVSVQRIRQARLPDGHAGKRPSPPGWEAAVIELARQQARQLDALADALSAADTGEEAPQAPAPQVRAPDREAQPINAYGLRVLRDTWLPSIPESEWDIPREVMLGAFLYRDDFLGLFTAGKWHPAGYIGGSLLMSGFGSHHATRIYRTYATRSEKRKYQTLEDQAQFGAKKLAESVGTYLTEKGVLESKQEGGGTCFRLPPAE